MTTYKKSAYEKLRDERVRQNEERMKQLGLDVSPMKKYKQERTKSRAATKKKRVVSKPVVGQERRSRRLAFAAADASGVSKKTSRRRKKHRDDDLVILDYRAREGTQRVSKQRDYYKDNNDDGNKGYNKTIVHRDRPKRRIKRISIEKLDLSTKDRKLLSVEIEHFLAKFREFLQFENKISEQNVRQVMRQATKFAHGEGVRYESKSNPGYSWPKGRFFMKGRFLKPMDDMIDLMKEGQECEDKWGRDHGNGWLISHPLKKLHLFQVFILKNPKFLKSQIRIKEF